MEQGHSREDAEGYAQSDEELFSKQSTKRKRKRKAEQPLARTSVSHNVQDTARLKQEFLERVKKNPNSKMADLLHEHNVTDDKIRQTLSSWASRNRTSSKAQEEKNYYSGKKATAKANWDTVKPLLSEEIKASVAGGNPALSAGQKLARIRDTYPEAVSSLPENIQKLFPKVKGRN